VTTTPRYGSPAASAPVQSGVVHVAYRNITIRPDTLKVRVGSTVVWTNYDPLEHNVTSQSGPQRFASKNFREGQTFSVKMTRPGVIRYLCTIHPATMNGTIEVVR
jgi:plastocyanin